MPRKIVRRSLDTETTGINLFHGSRPFFVTIYDATWSDPKYWSWDVDPLTRRVLCCKPDLLEIQEWINSTDELVLHNSRFDYAMLRELLNDHGLELQWDWGKVRDTIVSAHLIASNQPKDLTTQALVYLGIDIKPYETALEKVVQECRRMARRDHKDWMIAAKDLPCMPSAKEKTWSADMWLPRALAKVMKLPEQHLWNSVLPEYSNTDSCVTLPLHLKHIEIIKQRGHEKLYHERLKLLPVATEMEQTGITASKPRLYEQRTKYRNESDAAAERMKEVAARYSYDLELPKGGRNKSLNTFIFDHLKLPAVKLGAKSSEPSMDKTVLAYWQATLQPGPALDFVKDLRGKRSRDTACSYMDSYERFWLPLKGANAWYKMHPSLNMTGTDTLRWSSSNPNEQNISKKEDFNLRSCFGPAPGREWYSLDGMNLELRIPAYVANEHIMIELFERPKEPPYYGSNHLLNFSIVYPEIWADAIRKVGLGKVGPWCKEEYESTWYQWVKNGGFAKQYGGQRAKVDATFHKPGAYNLMESRFAGLAKLNAQCIKFAKQHGHIETLPDRTVDPNHGYPLLCTGTKYGHTVSPTIPLNYFTQGSACWWIARAMVRCWEYLKGTGARLVMQVHDELVFDFPKSLLDPRTVKPGTLGYGRTNLPAVAHIKRLMEQGGEDIGIPTPVSCKYHPETWAEGYSVAV
jgi:DNA polymerase I-like protein with 3'-5' exonuclease and polymerase domains